MDREILFRGKVKLPINLRGQQTAYRNGEWAYGFMDSIGTVRKIPVDTNTIGQYTGLTDKNGVKIFEGDIVETVSSQDDIAYSTDKFYVQFVQGNFYVCNNSTGTVLTSGAVWTLRSCAESVKVIGNVYDNPELLKENS